MRRAATAILPGTLLLLGLSTPLPLDLAASPTRLDLDRVLADAPEIRSAVLLVVLDGVRPTEIFDGTESDRGVPYVSADDLTPNLHRTMSRGLVLGAPDSATSIVASGPNFMSLPGYTEMFTGAPAACQRNDCTERPAETLVDVFRAVAPRTTTSR